MRLGDLDALKSDLKQYFSDGTLESVSAKLAFNMILRKIDEAPTVDLKDIYQEGYYDGHLEGYTKAINEERTQGDLISRSALKEDIVKLCRQINASNGITVPTLAFTRVIDNAPTVERVINVYPGGDVIVQEKRPQSEWIDYDNTFYKCPDCGYLLEKCCPQCQNKVILPKGGAE